MTGPIPAYLLFVILHLQSSEQPSDDIALSEDPDQLTLPVHNREATKAISAETVNSLDLEGRKPAVSAEARSKRVNLESFEAMASRNPL